MAYTRNLLYHVAPFPGQVWRRNIRQLRQRQDVFNGKRVVAVMTGSKLEPPEAVRDELGPGFETFTMSNNPTLRERTSFVDLLKRVESRNRHEATFYAHAKGVATKGDSESVMYWRNLMYHVLLDDVPRIEEALDRHPIVGTHRRRDVKKMADGVVCDWHFSGTFFWFRHDQFFARQWTRLPLKGYAVEACPGILFKYAEGVCLTKDGITNPYSTTHYPPEERILDPDYTPPVRVELGGGATPRGQGFINVDIGHDAEVPFDLETLSDAVRLPFADDSVVELYTSHTLEHVRNIIWTMREIVRICHVGAKVEIRVPHWNSAMAMCHDHKHTFAPAQVDHWTKSALAYWWADGPKRLELKATNYVPTAKYQRWKKLLPTATHDDICELCHDAVHETRWTFEVVPNI